MAADTERNVGNPTPLQRHQYVPPVYIELLPKIRSLVVSILLPSAHLPANPVVTESQITLPPTNGVPDAEGCTLDLPAPVDPASLSISRTPDGLNLKLVLRHSAVLPPDPSTTDSPSAALANLVSICCHACGSNFLLPALSGCVSRLTKAVELPSEYWHELTDCWACHTEDYSQMAGQKGGVVLAKQGVVMVGKSHVVLHPADIDFTALDVDLAESSKGVLRVGRTAPALCSTCRTPVGDYQFDTIPTSHSQVRELVHGIKLHKYRVTFQTGASQPTSSSTSSPKESSRLVPAISPHAPPPFRPFVTYFVDELRDMTEAHAAFRFAVSEKDSEAPRFLLWVLNWNVLISSTIAAPQLTPYRALIPAVKVLYVDLVPTSDVAPPPHVIALRTAWEHDPQVEQVSLHRSLCEEVLDALKSSSTHLPPSQRQSKGFSVGFFATN
ncbi:hypothetical protein HDU86_005368 [Geranomyces michiganensis]|nr:hypothetical protein HDU86_005368 [Geranomyces michiganensis]